MILIADSGSTKTTWWLVDSEHHKIAEFQTLGINPFYQTEIEIYNELNNSLIPHLNTVDVHSVFFYGAGCHFEDKKNIVKSALEPLFKNADIEINNDLLGACRALLLNQKGIACILGTGSNSCYYDGTKIVNNVSPLGFILGDEGSGAVLGKLLVGNVFKNQVSQKLQNVFLHQYKITASEVLDSVYKKPFPNRYLAKFAPFLTENIEEKEIYNIVYSSFISFFERNVMQYDYKHYPICFVGSVAFFLKSVLQDVALDLNLRIDKIEQSPMQGLFMFHTQKQIR